LALNKIKKNMIDDEFVKKVDDTASKLAQTANNVEAIGVSIENYKHLVVNDDWTVAMQTAIDNHKVVLIPSGTFNHTTLYLRTDTVLKGTGKTSILKNNTNASSIVIGHPTEHIFDCVVSNLFLMGNVSNPLSDGIEFKGNNPAYHVIHKVRIVGFGRNGIQGGHDGHVNNIEITGCFIQGNIGQGIKMRYGLGQINAVFIHHNDITSNANGIQFSGNNVQIYDNSIQNNKYYAVSVSEDSLDKSENTFGSSIRHNYTELNGSALSSNASVIGIFTCYANDGSSDNKLVRGLDISNNYAGEKGGKYASYIYCKDLKSSAPSSMNCVLNTKNNYAQMPFLTYNKTSALSNGTTIDEALPAMFPIESVIALPSYVEVRGVTKLPKTNNSRWNRVIDINNSPNKGKKFVVTLYGTDPYFSLALISGLSILNVKVVGSYDFSVSTRFSTDCTYSAPTKTSSEVVVTEGVGAVNIPVVSKITEVTFNGGVGFQFTIEPKAAGLYSCYFDLLNKESTFKYLAIDVTEVAI